MPSAFCWSSGFDYLIRIDHEHREVWANVENASAFVGWLITPCETLCSMHQEHFRLGVRSYVLGFLLHDAESHREPFLSSGDADISKGEIS